jgi:UPF0271 protein
MPKRIELGCDTGEAATDAGRAQELALLAHVSAVSIACGGHAGDTNSMRTMVGAAAARGCAIGGHPSYPDRAGFGRVSMDMGEVDLLDSVTGQVASLAAVCAESGVRIAFVKAHGALYHDVARDAELALAFAHRVAGVAPRAPLVGPIGAPALEAWMNAGVRTLAEGFIDRVYEADGSLRARTLPGALIEDPAIAAAQAVRLAGSCDLLCVHGDSPGAVAIASAARRALESDGFEVGGLIGGSGDRANG